MREGRVVQLLYFSFSLIVSQSAMDGGWKEKCASDENTVSSLILMQIVGWRETVGNVGNSV